MAGKKYAPIICKSCNTDHGDAATRDESCRVLEAEKRIAHLYHNRGEAFEIRYAQADREEALGNVERATTYREEAARLGKCGYVDYSGLCATHSVRHVNVGREVAR